MTITGHNWIPDYPDQPDTVVSVALFQFPIPNERIDFGGTTPTVDASGSFTVSFPITSSFPPGGYNACVGSVNVHTFCSDIGGGVPFQVVAAQGGGGGGLGPTATPTASHPATPGPGTATVPTQPTATPGTLPVSSTTADAGGGGGFPWLVGALGAVLVVGAGAAGTFFVVRRRGRAILGGP